MSNFETASEYSRPSLGAGKEVNNPTMTACQSSNEEFTANDLTLHFTTTKKNFERDQIDSGSLPEQKPQGTAQPTSQQVPHETKYPVNNVRDTGDGLNEDGLNESMQNLKVTPTLVSQMKLTQRQRIETLLDMKVSSSYPNWYLLGYNVYNNEPTKREKLDDLYLCECGGGNPGIRFLEVFFSSQQVTCDDFKRVAKLNQRNDIVDLLGNIEAGKFLNNITIDKKIQLARLLNTRSPIRNWQFFAEDYDMTRDQIKQIKSSIATEGVYSPTSRLLEWFELDDISIDTLKTACEEIHLKNVAKKLTEINIELRNRNQKK